MSLARRIIRLGRASLSITLPRTWVEKNNLKEGDTVFVEDYDNYLLISPVRRHEQFKEEVKVLEATPGDEDSLERMIIALYQAGYTSIKVVSRSGRVTPELRDSVRKTLKRLVGLEVFEEGSDYILLQMVADASLIEIPKVLGRMEVLVLNSIRDLEEFVATGDTSYLRDIIERDEEIDKFYFLLSRQVALSIMYSWYSPKVGVRNKALLLPLFNYGKTLERVGDVIASIARIAHLVNISADYVQLIRSSFENAVRAFKTGEEGAKLEIMKAYRDYFSHFEPSSLLDHLVGNILSLALDMLESRVEMEVFEEFSNYISQP
ncbi:phosphate uptake regulator PhoU [Infirmifilum lucidum]|uniref:Phosphate uptake regulator PhoU n=1 Tax=Infirmifilum lucidum TaxID=2776706 RepID=A0A7L9FKJ8_9CREN|nr:phosphate uptake regulator PhoU [Infirmifilum lucidum]QOJ79335.1 phosphate uptake regulator PhoU [Infirmifilum lucidum]